MFEGIGAALSLAGKKGYLENKAAKNSLLNKTNKTKIEAENYSIEDKRYE